MIPRVTLPGRKQVAAPQKKQVTSTDPIYASLTGLISDYMRSGQKPVFGSQGGSRQMVRAASVSAPALAQTDNCYIYQMTTRDGYTVFLREWLKPDYGDTPQDRLFPVTTQSILMLGGFPFPSMRVFSYQVNDENLSKKYRMITMEIRGFGDSSKPTTSADFSAQHLADDIQDAINLLQMHKVTLLAHSTAGTIATRYLQTYGQTALSGLILSSALTKMDFSNSAVGASSLDPFFAALLPSLLNMNNDLCDYCTSNHTLSSGLIFVSPNVDSMYKTQLLAMGMATSPATRQAFLFPPIAATNAILGTITLPTLIIHGRDTCGTNTTCLTKDNVVTIEHAVENYTLLRNHARSLVFENMPGVGHMPQAENPTLYNSYLDTYLSGL
jgi:non-heme chloroperoxidase